MKIFREAVFISWLIVALVSFCIGDVDKAILAMLLAILTQLNIMDS